jgi:hypothetical protein
MDGIYEDLTRVSILEKDEFDSLFISCSSLKDPLSYNGRQHTIEVVTFIDYDSFKAYNATRNDPDEKYPIDFARDEPDADEDRHEQAGNLDRGESEVLDDLHVLAGRDLADEDRRGDEHEREGADRVQDAVAHAFLEHVPGDQSDAA